ncbi:MAG: hypothetical protein IPP73_18660 [Chitinophagaceae bacterium]|nr:hypothetical protein [Chitinophagaceae bacterium]
MVLQKPKRQTGLPVSDTILVLNQALSEATSVKFMPDADALKQPYQFKDSILLSSQASILNVLPESVDGQNFKVMEENKITYIKSRFK